MQVIAHHGAGIPAHREDLGQFEQAGLDPRLAVIEAAPDIAFGAAILDVLVFPGPATRCSQTDSRINSSERDGRCASALATLPRRSWAAHVVVPGGDVGEVEHLAFEDDAAIARDGRGLGRCRRLRAEKARQPPHHMLRRYSPPTS